MTIPSLPLLASLLVFALVMLPIGRGVEYPMGVLSMLGVIALLRRAPRYHDPQWKSLIILFLAFALPMVLALPDAVDAEKSTMTTIGALRYLLSCTALLWLVDAAKDPSRIQAQLLNTVGAATALLLLLWCLDGLWQFLTGTNVLGYGTGDGYINGIFGDDDNVKFGITVALLMPVALLYAARHWPLPVAFLFLLLICSLVLLSGKRAAWISLFVELVALGLYYRGRGELGLRRLLAAGALALVTVATAYGTSDWVRQRSDVLMEAVGTPDFATLNRASGKRLPIWRTAVRMGEDNWVNGVGPRSFRHAYAAYADSDDEWAQRLNGRSGARASHAHQLLLELWTETGVIGLAGLAILVAVLAQGWRQATAAARSRALPFAVALAGMLFPLNSHAAFYSSWSATIMWLLVGLYLFALKQPRQWGSAR